MLIAAALLASLAPLAIDESDRFRKVYDSGAICLVEKAPESRTVAIQLYAAAKACPETAATHGWRHLLEHMVIKGRQGSLAERLETRSWIATADTYRDFMVIRLEGPQSGATYALDALAEILKPDPWNPEQIVREKGIVAQELGLLTSEAKLSIESWKVAFGDRGLDPQGDLGAMETATAGDLRSLHSRQFASDCLTLSVVGPVDGATIANRFGELLKSAPKPLKSTWQKRPDGIPGLTDLDEAKALFAPVPSYANPLTAWTLAAALAIASESNRRVAIYTPSIQNGLVIVGAGQDDGLSETLANFRKNSSSYFDLGRSMARAWYKSSRSSTSAKAFSNGIFQVQSLGGRPETLLENIEAMRPEDFKRGLDQFAVEGQR